MAYTYRNDMRIELNVRDNELVARLGSDEATDLGFKVNGMLSSASVSIATSKETQEEDLENLRSHGPAFLFYEDALTAAPFLITDRIIVTLKTSDDIETINDLLGEHALEVFDTLSETEYVLRLASNSEKDPISLVVHLNEHKPKGVSFVEHDLNHLVQPMGESKKENSILQPSDPHYRGQWHLHTRAVHSDFDPRSSSNCEEAWNLLGSYGDPNIVVGVTDDGCRLDHPDFDEKKFAGWGYFSSLELITHEDTDADPKKMYENGKNHGTSCCGIIAAEVDASLTTGGAPGCSLLPIKWESNSKGGLNISDTKLRKALNFIADKVDILSNSWGDPDHNTIWSSNVISKIRQLDTDWWTTWKRNSISLGRR